jgi:hypothetical protein
MTYFKQKLQCLKLEQQKWRDLHHKRRHKKIEHYYKLTKALSWRIESKLRTMKMDSDSGQIIAHLIKTISWMKNVLYCGLLGETPD